MRTGRIVGVALGVVALAVGGRAVQTAPELPAAGSESAMRLAPGPHPVATRTLEFVDGSRPTAANADYPGAPSRTLEVELWYPDGVGGAHPLAIYCHGFMSMRTGGEYLARHLASHGYVVAAPDFPLTHFFAPGGPAVEDAVNQPGDVSFLLSSLLHPSEADSPFDGSLDPERIAVFGLSLGGLTTTLATFHPALADPRIRAAVSIAGSGAPFTPRFFAPRDTPFLMIAGESDAIIDYEANAAGIPAKIRQGGLLSLESGTHAGFDALAGSVLRLAGNPDRPGCWALTRNLETDRMADHFAALGGPEIGVESERATDALPCARPLPATAMNVGRQQAITLLATHAFLESVFAATAEARAGHARFLGQGLAAEFEEVRYEAARGAGLTVP